jgi:glycosyltransferase involved in cell wall biosynthesis
MHICYLCNEYPPAPHGGIGMNTQTLARALSARGHTISVVGLYRHWPAGEEDDRGVRVIRLAHTAVRGAGFALNGLRLRRALERLHREQPIDLLEGPEWGLALVPRAFPAVKLVRMHGGHHFFSVTLGRSPRPWRSWLERRSFACADHFCAVSRFVAEQTRGLLHLDERPIEVLPNPIDVDRFRPATEPPVDGRLVFVGTVCEKKGVRELVQAFPAIAARVPAAHLWVVGRDTRDERSGGSFTEMLRALVPPALVDRVVFKGPIGNEHLPAVLATAQVCVYPSHMESQGIVILEAMAMAKPVVTSRRGPAAELIEDGVSGVLCDARDPSSISEAVTRLLVDAGLRRGLGARARLDAERRFSLPRLLLDNETFYRKCLATQPSLARS